MVKQLVAGEPQRALESQGLWQAPKFKTIWPNKRPPQAGGFTEAVAFGLDPTGWQN